MNRSAQFGNTFNDIIRLNEISYIWKEWSKGRCLLAHSIPLDCLSPAKHLHLIAMYSIPSYQVLHLSGMLDLTCQLPSTYFKRSISQQSVLNINVATFLNNICTHMYIHVWHCLTCVSLESMKNHYKGWLPRVARKT